MQSADFCGRAILVVLIGQAEPRIAVVQHTDRYGGPPHELAYVFRQNEFGGCTIQVSVQEGLQAIFEKLEDRGRQQPEIHCHGSAVKL